MISVVSTFSGAAGLDRGVLAGLGPDARLVSWCENNRTAQQVLRYHYPEAIEIHDIHHHPTVDQPDWLIGGPPCQSLSPAGSRDGIADGTKSGLVHQWADLVRRCRPRHVLVEEVPEGLDVDRNGQCWADVAIGGLVDMGYGVAWGVIGPRPFGIPQNRHRLFVLAALPTVGVDPATVGRRARTVLGDAACGRWSAEPNCQTKPDHARPTDRSPAIPHPGLTLLTKDRYDHEAETFIPVATQESLPIAPTLIGPGAGGMRTTGVEEVYVACNLSGGADRTLYAVEATHSLSSTTVRNDRGTHVVVRTHRAGGGKEIWNAHDTAPCLNTYDDTGEVRMQTAIITPRRVRRLTSIERERLMGWPDGWTATGRKPDGTIVEISRTARHRLTGNGVVSPIVECIVSNWVHETKHR